MIVGAYWHLNPVIPIFLILGFGIYMIGRIGGPLLPADTQVGPGSEYASTSTATTRATRSRVP